MVKLFVGGFPLEMTEMELAMMITPHGNISTIKIVRDRQTKKCKGYAFVEVLTEEDAVKIAAALDGEEMQDRVLTVKVSEDAPAKPVSPQRTNRQTYPRSTFNNTSRSTNDVVRPKRPAGLFERAQSAPSYLLNFSKAGVERFSYFVADRYR